MQQHSHSYQVLLQHSAAPPTALSDHSSAAQPGISLPDLSPPHHGGRLASCADHNNTHEPAPFDAQILWTPIPCVDTSKPTSVYTSKPTTDNNTATQQTASIPHDQSQP